MRAGHAGVAFVQAERHFAGDRFLSVADEGHEGVHLGTVPEAVVDHLGDFRIFAGKGADDLGIQFGVDIVPDSFFGIPQKYLKNGFKSNLPKQQGETAGCVALDQYGNITAGTSTGGRQNKTPGRVG